MATRSINTERPCSAVHSHNEGRSRLCGRRQANLAPAVQTPDIVLSNDIICGSTEYALEGPLCKFQMYITTNKGTTPWNIFSLSS